MIASPPKAFRSRRQSRVGVDGVLHHAVSLQLDVPGTYLRAEGLSLSWVGTGRLIFSHDYTDADIAAVFDRFVAAARAMRDDGWWWHGPEMTDRALKKAMLRELLAAKFGMRNERAPHAASSDTIGSKNSPRIT